MTTTAVRQQWLNLCEGCIWDPGDGSHLCGFVNGYAVCSRCGRQAAQNVFLPEANDPMRFGPQAEFSTCLDVEPFPPVIWDTNGYYRDLGVDPRASRLELRRAYVRQQGWKSVRLTYVMRQLVNAETRRRYDATPLGSLFLDHYIEEAIRRAWVAQKAKEGFIPGEDDDPVDPVEVVLDRQKQAKHDRAKPSDSPGEAWGWYRWRSVNPPTHRLAQWRGLLARALSDRKERPRIAVGLSHGMGPWQVIQVGFLTVVFLDDGEQPTEALAMAAASRVVNTEPRMEIQL